MNALDPIPFDELPRGSSSHPARGARFIAEVLDDSGIDAASDLYDEALELAREGQLNKARDRLRMLLANVNGVLLAAAVVAVAVVGVSWWRTRHAVDE